MTPDELSKLSDWLKQVLDSDTISEYAHPYWATCTFEQLVEGIVGNGCYDRSTEYATSFRSDVVDALHRAQELAVLVNLPTGRQRNALSAPDEEIERLQAERDALERTLLKHGFKRCDQPNCCGSWHGGHANERLLEISDALQQEGISLEGETLLSTIERLIRTKKYPKKIVASAGSRRARPKN